MDRFPKLKTGALSQYPTQGRRTFRTEIALFLDGTEQRYRDRRSACRRWIVDLTKLDESETARFWDFFRRRRGRAMEFEFEDPLSGEVLNSCRFDEDSATALARSEFDNGTRFVIAEVTT